MRPLFGKKNDKTTIAELEDYYANENSRKTAKNWLMALFSIFITIVTIIALFFAGQWVYEQFFQSDESSDSGSSETSTQQESSTSDTTTESGGVVDDGAVSTTNTDDSSSAATDSETSSDSESGSTAGTTTSEVPDTGAGEIVLILPLLAAVAGYLYSRNRQLKSK